ncbi:unnamed protein product [Caenorhabditis sp. 36 PRJEB53466]|nr:unnamed protein product [Caenorhabditis sp. 36 PRJEB53466]
MPAIQFKTASRTMDDGSKFLVPIVTMTSRRRHSNHRRVRIEWVRHSACICIVYVLAAVITTSYYSACFLTQYGAVYAFVDRSVKPMPILNEPTLTRVIMIQWLMLAAVLISGLSLFRRIFMPLYIFLAVMATNGTLTLFVVKMKQFADGKIPRDDLSLNLVGILLFTATAHNLVYLYAIHLYLNRSRSRVYRATASPPAYEADSTAEQKMPVDNFV